MSTAPWWGWLILFCVALVVVAWLAVTIIGTRAMRRMSESFDRPQPPLGSRRRR